MRRWDSNNIQRKRYSSGGGVLIGLRHINLFRFKNQLISCDISCLVGKKKETKDGHVQKYKGIIEWCGQRT